MLQELSSICEVHNLALTNSWNYYTMLRSIHKEHKRSIYAIITLEEHYMGDCITILFIVFTYFGT